jgi:hypothetical protein
VLKAEDLLDPILIAKIGMLDTETARELSNLCEEAANSVLGEEAWSFLSKSKWMIERAVPWIWDLARGVHFQSFYGPKMPQTDHLINQLSSKPLDSALRALLADRIDLAFIFTEDRIAEYIQGRDAITLDPASRERSFPWYPRLLLGYRIRLTTEVLRLMPPVELD